MIAFLYMGLFMVFETPLLSGYKLVLAYLDPGTGSFLVQLLIGGVVGALVVLKAYWTKIRSFFSKGNQDQMEGSQEPEQSNTVSDDE
ncbi:MAG: hypothetical protein H6667_19690 [Ardenticatenaceae bacterium]|nr:hypothetical protein [Ardenticatenaceae bacterium]